MNNCILQYVDIIIIIKVVQINNTKLINKYDLDSIIILILYC